MIMNAWYVAAWSREISVNGLFARKLFGEGVVLYRTDDGTVVALEDRCSHRAAPLSCGKREGAAIRCMYHGLKFNSNGQCIEVPGQTHISDTLRIRSYPVAEQDGLVWIWPGDSTVADRSSIMRITSHDDPDWKAELGGYIHFAADAKLVADNLLDFSHLAFVHINSIGNPEFAENRPRTESGEDWLRVSHWNQGIRPAPNQRSGSRLPDIVDRAQIYTWYLKGNIFDQTSAVSPANTGGFESTAPETVRKRTYIMVTPETETTCHYFWSVAHNDYLTDVPSVTIHNAKKLHEAFEEDRLIIEAQQRVLIERPDTRMIPLGMDANLVKVRRMHEKLIAKERNASLHLDNPAASPVPFQLNTTGA